MTALVARTALDLPQASADRRISAIVSARLGTPSPAPDDTAFWDAGQFGLDQVSLFAGATEEQRREVLDRCASGLLREAFYIEKSGLAFAAKMVLLADSTEERMMYSLFGAEEAKHLAAVSAHLGTAPVGTGGPFLDLLSELILDGDRESLVFVVQVVLEGWGLSHYRGLGETCRSGSLRAAIDEIVRDEAGHHGSGVVLHTARPPSASSTRRILEVMLRFLQLVQAGPQATAAAVEETLGGLSRPARVRLFTELGAEAHAAERLDLLKKLMLRADARSMVDALEAHGAFRPLSAEECSR